MIKKAISYLSSNKSKTTIQSWEEELRPTFKQFSSIYKLSLQNMIGILSRTPNKVQRDATFLRSNLIIFVKSLNVINILWLGIPTWYSKIKELHMKLPTLLFIIKILSKLKLSIVEKCFNKYGTVNYFFEENM